MDSVNIQSNNTYNMNIADIKAARDFLFEEYRKVSIGSNPGQAILIKKSIEALEKTLNNRVGILVQNILVD